MREIIMVASNLFGLKQQEKESLRALREAFEVARNRHTVSSGDKGILLPSREWHLNAAHPAARVRLGNALWREFNSHFALSETQAIPSVPVFFVTAVDIGCMTSIAASQVPIAKFIRQLRRGLQGLSYIGFLEPALYAHVAPGTNFVKRTGVNWHLHLFAWGDDRDQMKSRAAKLNARADNYQPIIPRPQGMGFHWKVVDAENIERLFRYMCRSPRKAYRIGRAKYKDPKGKGRFKLTQGKSILRPGQRVSLFHLLKRFSLDNLVVAGGEGVNIRRCALYAAGKPPQR
jgi:hypothetical protein